MHFHTHIMHLRLKTNPQFERYILILAYLCLHPSETQAQGNGRPMISGGLSKAICITAKKYSTSKTIQTPLNDASKFSNGDKSSCKKLKWNKCGSEAGCKKFECSSALPPKIKTRSNRITNKVVGGTDAQPHEFPYQIQINQYGHYCGGTILNENYIISAAHCFYGEDNSDKTMYTVVAGEHSQGTHEGKEQERRIKRIIIHEDYNPVGTKNDISLIELESTLALTRYVHPIIMPDANYVATGDAIVTGWGSLQPLSELSPDILQKVTVPIVPHVDCVKAYKIKNKVVGPNMMCAGILGVGGKDACQGDSGGPLAIKMGNGSYLLVGIVSWGISCAKADFPGVYTDVAKYLDWIYKNAT